MNTEGSFFFFLAMQREEKRIKGKEKLLVWLNGGPVSALNICMCAYGIKFKCLTLSRYFGTLLHVTMMHQGCSSMVSEQYSSMLHVLCHVILNRAFAFVVDWKY